MCSYLNHKCVSAFINGYMHIYKMLLLKNVNSLLCTVYNLIDTLLNKL